MMNLKTTLHIAALNLKDRVEFATVMARSRKAEGNTEIKDAKASDNIVNPDTEENVNTNESAVNAETENNVKDSEKKSESEKNQKADSKKKKVDDIGKADMQTNMHIKDEDPNTLNPVPGVTIDLNKICDVEKPADVTPNLLDYFANLGNPQMPPYMRPPISYQPSQFDPRMLQHPNVQPQQPVVNSQPVATPASQPVPPQPTAQPVVPQQPANAQATPVEQKVQQQSNSTPVNQQQAIPMPGAQPIPQQPNTHVQKDPVLDVIEQRKKLASKVKSGFGRHKVDNPQPATPKPVKAKEEKVEIDLDNMEKIDIEPIPKKEMPEVITNEIPKAERVEKEPEKPMFDNTALFEKYRYLADIESIALENGVQLRMFERPGINGNPSGLLTIVAYTGDPAVENRFKSFTIDTGMIIDKRAKVFPGVVPSGYENMQAYAVLVSHHEENPDGGKPKIKNEINRKLFEDIFKGGVEMLDPKKGLYTPNFLELNKRIALITMPTRNMNSNTRKAIRDRLMDAMKKGVFDKALSYDPNSRFVFKSYDKKSGLFVLSNEHVPKMFGEPCTSTKKIEIRFAYDTATVDVLA